MITSFLSAELAWLLANQQRVMSLVRASDQRTATENSAISHGLVRELVGDAFDITDTFVDHVFPYRVPEYLQHRYQKVGYLRALPPPVFRMLERRFGWHLCVTAIKR